MADLISGWRIAGRAVLIAAFLAGCAEREPRLPGEREAVRPVVQNDAPDAPTTVPPLALPQPQANRDWGHLNGNPAHLAPNVALNERLSRVWSVSIGQGANRRVPLITAPVVLGGQIYAMDAAAQVTAVSQNGDVLWRTNLTPPGERGVEGFGGGLAATESALVATTGFGEVVRLDPATGAVLWRAEAEGTFRAAPTIADDKVVAVARGDLAYGVELDTGMIAWRVEGTGEGAGLVGGSSPAVRGPLAVLPFQSGEVRAILTRNGLTVWTAAVTGGRRDLARARINDISGDPVIDNDTVYVSNQAGRLVALDRRDGARLWTQQVGAFGPAVVAGGSLFIVSDAGQLMRLSATDGAILWRQDLPRFGNPRRERDPITHFGPLLAGGRLIVASSDRALRSFDPETGADLGASLLPAGATSQPAIAAGRLYLVSRNGELHAFQ